MTCFELLNAGKAVATVNQSFCMDKILQPFPDNAVYDDMQMKRSNIFAIFAEFCTVNAGPPWRDFV